VELAGEMQSYTISLFSAPASNCISTLPPVEFLFIRKAPEIKIGPFFNITGWGWKKGKGSRDRHRYRMCLLFTTNRAG